MDLLVTLFTFFGEGQFGGPKRAFPSPLNGEGWGGVTGSYLSPPPLQPWREEPII